MPCFIYDGNATWISKESDMTYTIIKTVIRSTVFIKTPFIETCILGRIGSDVN